MPEAYFKIDLPAYFAKLPNSSCPGTCTFYGTANSNQMLMEFMGLHLPGSSFVPPNTPLRTALTKLATKRALEITSLGKYFTPAYQILDEKAFVNGIVGLMATGGSTNLVLHLPAMAKAAGIKIELSISHFKSRIKISRAIDQCWR